MRDNPRLIKHGPVEVSPGMFSGFHLTSDITLRDLFAMAALAGIVGTEDFRHHEERSDGVRGGAIASASAYVLADAMLKEREKRNG